MPISCQLKVSNMPLTMNHLLAKYGNRDAAIGGSVRVGTLCGQMFPMQSGVSAEVVTSADVVISFPPSPTLSPLTTSVLLQGTALGAQGVITAWSAPRKICRLVSKVQEGVSTSPSDLSVGD